MTNFIALHRANAASILHDIDLIFRAKLHKRNIEITYYSVNFRNKNLLSDSSIHCKGCDFSIKHISLIKQLNTLEIMRIFLISLFKTISLLTNILMSNRAYILNYNDVIINESVISRLNRSHKLPYFNFFLCFKVIMKNILIIFYFKHKYSKDYDALIVMDWHYEERTLARSCDPEKPYYFWATYNLDYSPYNMLNHDTPFFICPTYASSDHIPENVEKYLAERVSDPARSLGYLDLSTYYDVSLNVPDQQIDTSRNLSTAVLYLQSFVDGFIDNKFDGFWSQTDYVMFVLRQLVRNDRYERILLKPHPLTGLIKLDVDLLNGLLKKIKAKYGSSVIILPVDYNLSQIGNHVCITHHGSVAEESFYSGNPVIASSFGLWVDHPGFFTRWKNHSELLSVLNMDPNTFTTIRRPDVRLSFYRYISAYRLSDIVTRVEYGDLLGAVMSHIGLDEHKVKVDPFVSARDLDLFLRSIEPSKMMKEVEKIYQKEIKVES